MSAAAGLLQGFHAVIAWRRGPHWLLNDQDAKQYGTALANALRHLPVTVAQKYVDFAALGVAVCHYDGIRLAEDIRLSREAARARRPSAQVFQFSPPPQRPNSGDAVPPGGSPAPPGAASPSPGPQTAPGPFPGGDSPIAPDYSVTLEGA